MNWAAAQPVSGALPRFKVQRQRLRYERDTQTLLELLQRRPPSLGLLLGHSKGSLTIDYVLERLARRGGAAPLANMQVITLGAVVDLPASFPRSHQFLGALDWFGAINSRLDIAHRKVTGAWHHLNSALPAHLPVQRLLESSIPLLDDA